MTYNVFSGTLNTTLLLYSVKYSALVAYKILELFIRFDGQCVENMPLLMVYIDTLLQSF